jgi:hypothetical protein
MLLLVNNNYLSLIKQQFFLTHTVLQIQIPALLGSLCYEQTFCQNVVSTKIGCPNIFAKTYHA